MAGLSSFHHHPKKDTSFSEPPGLHMYALSSFFLYKVAEIISNPLVNCWTKI